jgi:hypothetical protein
VRCVKFYNILIGKPGGKRPLGRSRRRYENDIKMGLKEKLCEAWTGFSWLRIGSNRRLFCSR